MMESYSLKELLEFFIRQNEMDFKVIEAVAKIMLQDDLPMHFRVDTCVELLRQNGLVSIEKSMRSFSTESHLPLEEFYLKNFNNGKTIWEVLN